MERLDQLRTLFRDQTLAAALLELTRLFPGEVCFSTSLGQEDQVLTDVIASHQIPIRIFTIDTGRLFQETYELLDKTVARYKIPVTIYFPNGTSTEAMVNQHGINLFYESSELRKKCCEIRKVEPLNRALAGARVWITGLRADQTSFRKDLPIVEWLEEKQMYKVNPLIHWTYESVINHLQTHSVPYNPLHDAGFISIGCAPCTRAISPGEDPRAGRWWWESSQKECGLHLVK